MIRWQSPRSLSWLRDLSHRQKFGLNRGFSWNASWSRWSAPSFERAGTLIISPALLREFDQVAGRAIRATTAKNGTRDIQRRVHRW